MSLEHRDKRAEIRDEGIVRANSENPPFIKGGCQALLDSGIFNDKKLSEKPLCQLMLTSPLKKGSDISLISKVLSLTNIYSRRFQLDVAFSMV
jgi:hypothetical protein